MRQSQEGRALRQFTLSTGKSAGRNSSGHITVFHRWDGSKRLQRRIDLKRSTSSMGIVERIEYDPNRSSRIALVLWISCVLWDWGLTWPFFVFFVDGIDWILSSMDGLPLSVGGSGSDAGPSSSGRPELDLNQPPAPEPGLDLNGPPPIEPEPTPPTEPAPGHRPFSSLSKKEELKKNVKRLRYYKGMLNYWEGEMDKCIQKDMERRKKRRSRGEGSKRIKKVDLYGRPRSASIRLCPQAYAL
ncbi:hypothetical protein CsSME_00047130 [Camellia sinensis var. sinensis]